LSYAGTPNLKRLRIYSNQVKRPCQGQIAATFRHKKPASFQRAVEVKLYPSAPPRQLLRKPVLLLVFNLGC